MRFSSSYERKFEYWRVDFRSLNKIAKKPDKINEKLLIGVVGGFIAGISITAGDMIAEILKEKGMSLMWAHRAKVLVMTILIFLFIFIIIRKKK